jgi:hypothetical protein
LPVAVAAAFHYCMTPEAGHAVSGHVPRPTDELWASPSPDAKLRQLYPFTSGEHDASTTFLTAAGLATVASAFPQFAVAETRAFAPTVGPWRSFEIATRLEIIGAGAGTQGWVPIPNVNSDWQISQDSVWSGNEGTALPL